MSVDAEANLDYVDPVFAKRLLNEVLMRAPEGRELTFRELQDLLRAYGIPVWDRVEVTSADEAVAAGE